MRSATRQRRPSVSRDLASIIRERAEELDISLAEVARRAGMAPQYLNKILQGEREPAISKVESLAEALKMRLELVSK